MTEPSKALAQLTEESKDDPSTPFFWETVYALAKQGKDIANPAAWVPWDLESYQACQPMEVDLVGTSLRDQIIDLKRRTSVHTSTQALPILDLPTQPIPTIFSEWGGLG